MSHTKAKRDAQHRQASTGEPYARACRIASSQAAQQPRLDRDQTSATTAMRTMGFAQLMAAGAKARAFPHGLPGRGRGGGPGGGHPAVVAGRPRPRSRTCCARAST